MDWELCNPNSWREPRQSGCGLAVFFDGRDSVLAEQRESSTHRTTSLRGLPKEMTGKRKKQMTKQARAPRLQAAKINRRSHRLTNVAPVSGPVSGYQST